MLRRILLPLQLDGITCFGSNSNDDEASQPLQCFDKNLFVFSRVPSEHIAVSEQYNSGFVLSYYLSKETG